MCILPIDVHNPNHTQMQLDRSDDTFDYDIPASTIFFNNFEVLVQGQRLLLIWFNLNPSMDK